MENPTTETTSPIAPTPPITDETLRDKYAQSALTGLLAAQTASPTASPNFAAVVKLAFGYADAALLVRNPPSLAPPADAAPPPADEVGS